MYDFGYSSERDGYFSNTLDEEGIIPDDKYAEDNSEDFSSEYSSVSEETGVYEGYSESEDVKDIKGITDVVTGYTYTNLSYPCIVFKKGMKLEKHKVTVISNMVKSKGVGLVKDTSLYFLTDDDQMFKLGMINGMQVGSLIDIAGRDNLIGFAEDGRELKDSLIYTLCVF